VIGRLPQHQEGTVRLTDPGDWSGRADQPPVQRHRHWGPGQL